MIPDEWRVDMGTQEEAYKFIDYWMMELGYSIGVATVHKGAAYCTQKNAINAIAELYRLYGARA